LNFSFYLFALRPRVGIQRDSQVVDALAGGELGFSVEL